jgi:glycerol-3-phosphate dehydrogenase
MQREPDRLSRGEFDLLVIGGGITGACIAHDAALRGLSVALVEKDDFGGATSSASSKLLHGGIRYLQQGRLDKVRESAMERAAFQAIAPQLSSYVPFLIPTYAGWARGKLALSAGVRLYEWLTAGQNDRIPDPARHVPSSEWLTAAELHRHIGGLAPLGPVTGACVIYESHMHSSERMTLAFIKTAARNGAVVANYVAANGYLQSGRRVSGVRVRDTLAGREFPISARLTVNAAGPWLAAFDDNLAAGSLARRITAFSYGAHIVTRPILRDAAIALSTRRRANAVVTRGGRHVFVIPWRGHALIGTSDRPFTGNIDDVRPTEEDVADLIGDVNGALPGAGLSRDDVRHAFAGLYPLTEEIVRGDVYQGSGDYQIADHAARDGIEGCMSVLGAKFTTARRLAERAIDLACRKLERPRVACETHRRPLVGGEIRDGRVLEDDVRRRYPTVPADTVRHLIASYGSAVHEVLTVGGPDGQRRITPLRESVEAEIVYAVEREMAVRLEDVIFRRTGIGTVGHPGEECLRRCADIIGTRLGWTPDRRADEIRRTERRFLYGPSASTR